MQDVFTKQGAHGPLVPPPPGPAPEQFFCNCFETHEVQTSIPQICRVFTNKHNILQTNQLFSGCDWITVQTLQKFRQLLFIKSVHNVWVTSDVLKHWGVTHVFVDGDAGVEVCAARVDEELKDGETALFHGAGDGGPAVTGAPVPGVHVPPARAGRGGVGGGSGRRLQAPPHPLYILHQHSMNQILQQVSKSVTAVYVCWALFSSTFLAPLKNVSIYRPYLTHFTAVFYQKWIRKYIDSLQSIYRIRHITTLFTFQSQHCLQRVHYQVEKSLRKLHCHSVTNWQWP